MKQERTVTLVLTEAEAIEVGRALRGEVNYLEPSRHVPAIAAYQRRIEDIHAMVMDAILEEGNR